ncbi:MAG: hypothetical protein U0V56_11385 [Actinomycetota bacterium]
MAAGSRRGIAALMVAVGGVLVGHRVTYLVLEPSPHARRTLLGAGGHAYLAYANDLALIAALAAIATIFLGRLMRAADGLPTRRSLAIRLALFQAFAFATMETMERITAGVPLAGLLHRGLLPLGIAIQVALALLLAQSIRWLLRIADAVVALIGSTAAPRRDGPGTTGLRGEAPPPRRVARSAAGPRDPPPLPSIG